MIYVEHLLILACTFSSCISIFAFVFVDNIPVGITSSTVGLKIFVSTAGIKKYKSTINKQRKKH